jgi:hypothetical protein
LGDHEAAAHVVGVHEDQAVGVAEQRGVAREQSFGPQDAVPEGGLRGAAHERLVGRRHADGAVAAGPEPRRRHHHLRRHHKNTTTKSERIHAREDYSGSRGGVFFWCLDFMS